MARRYVRVSRTYLLDILRKECDDNKIGLYRDGGLNCFQNLSGPASEKKKKNFTRSSKSMG